MRFLLTSSGFTSTQIEDACAQLCAKPAQQISIAVINEAYAVEEGDKRWLITELERIAKSFGGTVDLVDLLALDHKQVTGRIVDKDALYVVGGQPDYLMSVFQRTGFSSLLLELPERMVYVGSSAGSMVAGRRISSQLYGAVFGESVDYGVGRYLEFVDCAVLPHYGSTSFAQNRSEVIENSLSHADGKVFGLRDDQALSWLSGAMSFVGGSPFVAAMTAHSKVAS